ncbi:MAG: aldehyde dehydrogenase family protein [Chloroflexi bacterium]|nr:aldehyde dehydrogenase family protein [Chloroflexota bacterium]MDL1886068.1 aldehyde dehydrogenase family protein [Anaerolineae bacterium CFX8]
MMMRSTMPVLNPYDGSVVDSVPQFTEQDVREAISRAENAAKPMANMPAYKRGAVLNQAARLIQDQVEDLARLMALENGKPVKLARGEINRAVETFQFAADEARRLHGETVPMDAAVSGVGKFGYYVRVPVGIVAAITPFNFPLNLVAHKVAPAIAAGCPVVLKPAPATPLTALRLSDILREAGLPEGAFEVVTGDADVGAWLVEDPRIAMITFTGSPPVARKISEKAGLRRVTFELGGNAATVIDEDANIVHAVSRTIMGGFAYSGQVCNSVQRIYIHRSRYDEFRRLMIEETGKLVLGDPLDEATDIGPVINEAAAERIDRWIAEAVAQGATVAAGGARQGALYRPTILENVTDTMQVMCAEVFGPVVALVPFDDFDAALAAADSSPFGLQAGVYTRDINKAMRAVQRLNVGGVMINDVPTFRVDQMPYGGNKESGIGREGPRFAIEEMTTLKMVVINIGV